jgi:hypothetical protein
MGGGVDALMARALLRKFPLTKSSSGKPAAL